MCAVLCSFQGALADNLAVNERTLSLSAAAMLLSTSGESRQATTPNSTWVTDVHNDPWAIAMPEQQHAWLWLCVYIIFLCLAPLLSAFLGAVANVASEASCRVQHHGSSGGGGVGARRACGAEGAWAGFAASMVASWSCVEVFVLAAIIMQTDLVDLFEKELADLTGQSDSNAQVEALLGTSEELLSLDFQLLPAAGLFVLFWVLSTVQQLRTMKTLLGVHPMGLCRACCQGAPQTGAMYSAVDPLHSTDFGAEDGMTVGASFSAGAAGAGVGALVGRRRSTRGGRRVTESAGIQEALLPVPYGHSNECDEGHTETRHARQHGSAPGTPLYADTPL